MEIVTDGYLDELNDFVKKNKIKNHVLSYAVENGEVVGVCTGKNRKSGPLKIIELYVLVDKASRNRILTRNRSLVLTAYNRLYAEKDTTYAGFRGVTCQVVNPAVSNELMKRFGFRLLSEVSRVRVFERTFS